MNKNQNQIIAIFFFGLFLFVMYQLFVIFSPFFEAIFWASILTFAFYPLHKRLVARTGRPVPAAIITSVVIFLVVIVPAFLVLSNLINQTLDLYQHVNAGGLTHIIDNIKNLAWLQAIHLKITSSELFQQYLSDWPLRITRSLAEFTTAQIASWTKNIVLILLNFILVIFLLFSLLYYGERIYLVFQRLVPLEEKDKKIIFSKINETFASVIRGQFLTSLVQGTLTGATFAFLGLPAPTFFGCVTFICTLIPVLGATSVWLPFTIYLLLTQEILKGVVLGLVGLFVISLIDNILKPILIGERIKIPVILLFFGVLGGLRAYGMTGVFLGPLFISLFFVLINIYQERYHHS